MSASAAIADSLRLRVKRESYLEDHRISFQIRPTERMNDEIRVTLQERRTKRTALLNSLRVLLVPAYAQVCFMKTERKIMGADIVTSTIVCYTECIRFRNV
jgi:hypothetical protein